MKKMTLTTLALLSLGLLTGCGTARIKQVAEPFMQGVNNLRDTRDGITDETLFVVYQQGERVAQFAIEGAATSFGKKLYTQAEAKADERLRVYAERLSVSPDAKFVILIEGTPEWDAYVETLDGE